MGKQTLSQNVKEIYKWLFIPFLMMQVGIFADYWPNFINKNWGVHIHYWLGTAWFVFLILQPYLIAKSKLEQHRFYGMIGFFIAGGVVFGMITLYEHDIRHGLNAEVSGSDEARYYTSGIMMQNILLSCFILAILMGIKYRKNLEEHSWWLICSAFYVMLPAVGRGMVKLLSILQGPNNVNYTLSTALTCLAISGCAVVFAWRFQKWRHLATWIAIFITPVAYWSYDYFAQLDWHHELMKTIIGPDM
ncbi:MAG: hypothetical protein CMO01_22020 [Thalassobius sp.]|nr:hypothetical protein [Thalassovita sp.]|tara:strand:- start:41 stop:781 length:741 start_codon:yes stop_codon:yes gene_type:complete